MNKLMPGQKLIDRDGKKWVVCQVNEDRSIDIHLCTNPLIKRKLGFYCDFLGPTWLDEGGGVYTLYSFSVNTIIVVFIIAVLLNISFVIMCYFSSPCSWLIWPLTISLCIFNMGATWWCWNGGSWRLPLD